MPVTDPRGNGAVQLVVTDLDGTLSDAAERIHPASVQAIRDLEAGGVPVLVATGRRLRMACAVLEAGGLTGPAVVLDGALGLDLRDGRVFHQVAFPAAAAARGLAAFTAAGLSRCVYVARGGWTWPSAIPPRPPPPPWPGPCPGWPSTTCPPGARPWP